MEDEELIRFDYCVFVVARCVLRHCGSEAVLRPGVPSWHDFVRELAGYAGHFRQIGWVSEVVLALDAL